MTWAALALVLSAAPARFVLEVASVPVATLTVHVEGERFVYEATHFLEEGDANFRVERALSPTPEVLALLTPPPLGCRDVVEERTGKAEALCVTESDATHARGTLAGAKFTASYVANQLERIEVGAAKWSRVADGAAVVRPDESPFVLGVAVESGPRALRPAVKGATWLKRSPRGIGDEDARARCLVLARKAVKAATGRRLAVGLVIEAGRAYPHAWVVDASGPLDPSVPPDDPVLSARRYVELPAERAGAFFLALFEGQAAVVVPK